LEIAAGMREQLGIPESSLRIDNRQAAEGAS